MMSEYDDRDKDYWRTGYVNCIVKIIDDVGLEDEVEKLNTLTVHLGEFVLSNSKKNMNIFIQTINGYKTNDVFYTDTDSLYIEKKHSDN